jgi:hypothetical protein
MKDCMTRLLLALLLLCPVALFAQAPSQERPDTSTVTLSALSDSLAKLDSTLAILEAKVGTIKTKREKYEAARRRAYRVEPMYAAGQAGALALNVAFPIQRDPGGYKDSWVGGDKLIHANIAFMLTDGGIGLGARPWVAASITCLSAYAFEHTQAIGGGYVSNRDAVASCAGAWAAVVVRRFDRAMRRGRVPE